MNATASSAATASTPATTTRRLALRGGVVLGGIALAVGLTACGDNGTRVYQRDSNGATHGIAALQPGHYKLDLSCTDHRSTTTTKDRNGHRTTRKIGSSPTVYFSTVVDGRQVKTNAYCTGSDTEKFTIATPTTLNLDATVTGSATYRATVYLLK